MTGGPDSAVILAAGMGTRLAGELDDRPKGFLRLGERPIIEESIDLLIAAGCRAIVIVTGHLAGHFDALTASFPGVVRTVYNAEYATSGSMYSLYCARDAVDGAFLLLESDLIYEPRALDAVCAHASADAVLLSGPTGAGDEVFVRTDGGQLTSMSKDPMALRGEVAGELVGISKISPALFRIMTDIADDAFRDSLRFDYETDCLVRAATRRDIACPLIADLVWSEIDDPSHLRRARDQIYPEIRRRVNAAR